MWFKPGLAEKHPQSDQVWTIGLLVAALILFSVNLGGVALRDWDEGTVAQIAREIARSPSDSLNWLFPTLWGNPYFNKPPLIHNLIALAYSLGGVNEWTSRLPGAMLTALSVPLLYWTGRELFQRRLTAGFSALVYLTMLPVVRHGRLAMLDGAMLCFVILLMWCVLRSRRNSLFALGIGIALGLVGLTKGAMVAVLFGAIALGFLMWDTPRLLSSPLLWLGIVLGCAPLGFWYSAQLAYHGSEFIQTNLVNQSARRIWQPVENHAGPPWYYLLELLKYGVPWFVLWPLGLKRVWEHRNWSWARLLLIWVGGFFVVISIMVTKLPWYVLPIYPALALVTGVQLTHLWDNSRHSGEIQSSQGYSWRWAIPFGLLAIAAWGGAVYFGVMAPAFDLLAVCVTIGLTLSAATLLISRHNPQFIPVLVWGTYLALLALLLSNHWVWELGESYPVKPVAVLVQAHTPSGQIIFTSHPINRPSLSFYSDRRVQPASCKNLQRRWDNPRLKPYLLLDGEHCRQTPFEPQTVLGAVDGWTLITRPSNREAENQMVVRRNFDDPQRHGAIADRLQ